MSKVPWKKNYLALRGMSSNSPGKRNGFGGGKGIEELEDAINPITG